MVITEVLIEKVFGHHAMVSHSNTNFSHQTFFRQYNFWTRNWPQTLLILLLLLLFIAIKFYTAILTDIPHRLTELDFLFFQFDGIYERFKIVAYE